MPRRPRLFLCFRLLQCKSFVDVGLHTFLFKKYRKQAKLLVLGGMNELGDLSQELHIQTGRSINLAPTDKAIIIGEYAKELADGMIENGAAE